MDEQVIRARLAELAETITAVPRAGAACPSGGTYVSHMPAPSSRTVEDMLDHVRLQIKYLMFDLEATRRENQYLRQMLERRPNLGEGPESV